VARLAEVGLLRFNELWIEGACRATDYGLDDGRSYYVYSGGYDPEWKNASPGMILLGLSLEDAIKRGLKRYDFLRGTEGYKFDWATSTRETVSVLITRRSLPAMLFTARRQTWKVARATAKTLLPERAVEWMRNWHSARRREQRLSVKEMIKKLDCVYLFAHDILTDLRAPFDNRFENSLALLGQLLCF
jgi:CelD/BcsL family acetyltransferase involved in cellulose biosynthesis